MLLKQGPRYVKWHVQWQLGSNQIQTQLEQHPSTAKQLHTNRGRSSSSVYKAVDTRLSKVLQIVHVGSQKCHWGLCQ